MGVQSGINQILGTAAGAATLGKHISEQKKANIKQEEANVKQEEANELAKKEAAINAADRINDTIDEYNGLEHEIGATNLAIKDKENELASITTPTGKPKKGHSYLEMTKLKYDAKVMQDSLSKMSMQRDAKKLQAEIFRDQINEVGKNGKDMGMIQLPWEKEIK